MMIRFGSLILLLVSMGVLNSSLVAHTSWRKPSDNPTL